MAIFGRSYSRPVTAVTRQPASVIIAARSPAAVSVSGARIRNVAAIRPITLQHTGLGVTGRNAAALISTVPAFSRMQPIRDYTQTRQGHGPIKAVSIATAIALVGGNNETATVNTSVLIPPSVLVTDQFGFAMPGILVTFAITSGGGSLTGASQVTNSSGIAMVGGWQLGALPGTNTLTASSVGLTGSPVLFTATGIAQANPPLPDGPPSLPQNARGLTFQQTDSAAVVIATGSNRPLNSTANNRLCIGTPGTTDWTVTLDAGAKDVQAVRFDIPVPQFSLWVDGDWIVRLNIRDPNPVVTWDRTELWWVSSTGTVLGLLGTSKHQAFVLTTPGVKRMVVHGIATPTRSYGDRIIVLCCFSNQGTLPPWYLQVSTQAQSFGFIADQQIDSPFQG